MQVAIRPPEYFPRCSVMALIDHVDEFIVADTFAYSRQSYQNRTPIRTPDGTMWLTVPLSHESVDRPIAIAKLSEVRFWMGKHGRSLVFNYSSTPFYEHYAMELEAFLGRRWTTLGEVTCASIELVASWLGIRTRIRRLSELGGAGSLAAAGPLLDGRRLVALDDTAIHDGESLDVDHVKRFSVQPYVQNFDGFEADVSVLDLIFNWGPEALPMLRDRLHGEPL